MKEKLTLSIEKETKKRAKRYAKAEGRSISEMVQEFLDAIAQTDDWQPPEGSITAELAGSLELPEKYEGMDYKQIIQDVLIEKYDRPAAN
jgi:hypothetical protein